MSNIESISDSIKGLRKSNNNYEAPRPKFAPKEIAIEEDVTEVATQYNHKGEGIELAKALHRKEVLDAVDQEADDRDEVFKPRFGKLKSAHLLKEEKTPPLERVYDKYVCRQVRVRKSDWDSLDDFAEDLQFIKARNRDSSKNRVTTNTIIRGVVAEFMRKLQAYDKDISHIKSEDDVKALVKSILNNR